MSHATAHPWWLLLATLLLSLTLSFSHSPQARPPSASSTVTAGRPLSGGNTIESQGGNFVLGFFSPGESHKFYLGIWFKKIPKITPVWVANRETPLRDRTSSELAISGDRNLVLLNHAGARVWSTNVTSVASNSTVAELLDTGNLVLTDGHNSSRVIWQSFDHLTDTWLPDCKLGLNKVTGEAQRLVSWKNLEDPAPGIYSLGIDPKGSSEYSMLWNGTVKVWSSGKWNGRFFSNIPEMGPARGTIVNIAYISNEKENYFTCSFVTRGVINRLVVDLSGQIKQLTWVDDSQGWMQFWAQPKQCEVYHLCGPFGVCNDERSPSCSCLKGFEEASPGDWALDYPSGGCSRRTPLQCEASSSGDQDRFYAMPSMGLPKNPQPWPAQTAGECEFACLSNCSCSAYSYDDGCSMWHQGLFNLMQMSEGAQDGKTLYLRLAALELQTNKPSKRKTTGIAIGAATGALAALVFVWVLIWRHRRRRLGRLNLFDGSLVPFSYGELKRVTKNFSMKLGGGGFGSVFKGTMPDSTEIAVKRLEGAGQGEKQFRTEVSTIGMIQHVNLVRLRGFCSERSKRLLVYDYMPRGSLENVLFHDSAADLKWKMRYQIILGTARGLVYLHEKCRDCIIHCDIKPENILLDAAFVPKVADFGLAKLVGRDFSRVLTTIRGTFGYLAPEWISGESITVKADVYSYGMMVFEIVSGRRNSEEQAEELFKFFPSWAAKKLMTGEVLGLLDPRLEGDANIDELNRVFRVAYWCIQDDEKFRPSMGQVVQILEGVIDVDMPPMPRYLQFLAESVDNTMFFSNVSSNPSSQMPNNDASTSSKNQSSTTSASNH